MLYMENWKNTETLKSVLNVKHNLTNLCEKFHDSLIIDPNLLQSIYSDLKYNHKTFFK